MYELANTSLPNGLIAGTHGFATVAMTKGLPDTLRARLETYCAYTHRSSAHDVSYSRENPVNWFHVVLPQGEHIMGRVAPADFDYTGRTNRLARLLVFPKGEVPGIGGASVLRKESSRFVAPWSGDARWLDVDKLTPGRLRLDRPPANCDAPTWRAMFGDGEGLKLAKGFARQLSKNMSSGGRTIYFKTSTTWDLDGTKLLALFADLIDMLPVSDRQKVSFSTYPVALPQGTVCYLRGVFDRDRIFDAAASTQAWIDCEKGVVHNASLLPPEDVKQAGVAKSVVPVLAPTAATNRPVGVSRPAPSWMPPKKDGTKALFIGIVITVAAIILVAVGVGIYAWNETTRKNRESGDLQAQERLAKEQKDDEVLKTIESEHMRKEAEQQRKFLDGKRAADEKTRREDAERKKAEAAKRKQEQANKKTEMEQKVKENARLKQVEEERRKKFEHERIAFIDAKEIKILEHGIQAEYSDARDRQQMTNGTLRVFWYGKDDALTNAPAGFRSGKNRSVKSLEFHPKPNELVKETSGMFLIWFDMRKKVAYWDWSPLDKTELTGWFAETNEVNLVDKCFGLERHVREMFAREVARPWRFTIEWDGSKPIVITDEILAAEYFNPKNGPVFQQQIDDLTNRLEQARKNLDLLTSEFTTTESNVRNYETKMSNLKELDDALKNKSKKDKKLALSRDKEEDLRKQKRELEKEIKEFIKKSFKLDVSSPAQGKPQIDKRKEDAETKKTNAEKVVKDLEGKLSDLRAGTTNGKDWRAELRGRRFRIIGVEGGVR